ncbi:AAA family ATPase [Solihabitans fulvus]|uniref:AAA family ATPase n=1 Tax=Solihabitans fulvus TaxID=1892852 RepID=A0A5B2WPU5_9PSEU|nr:LuxR family transcriptional regulator [Solihabitans fulvus]KAA2252546.1 AAA family ATPase [Solihabitans fulvus]
MSNPVRGCALIGRGDELSRLVGWVDAAAAGRGRAVLVEGEPGIGKSTLLRAACAAAERRGCQAFWGAGDELGQALPLLPLLECLRIHRSTVDGERTEIIRLLRGELAADSADLTAAAGERLVGLVDDLCAAAPTVLAIDDLQWADPATLAVWGRLTRSARQLPLLLIGATRPVPRRDDVAALRRSVEADGLLRLGPLSEQAVRRLLTELTGGTPGDGLRRLADGAAGNPLYLTELVDALARGNGVAVADSGVVEVAEVPVPDSLPAAIADRLGFLTPSTRDAVRAAALLGVEFSVADLAIVLRRRIADLVAALDEACAAGVLTEATDGLAFRHPLIRAALYGQLPAAVRAAWHRDAARALAEAGASVDRVARQLLPALDGPDADALTARGEHGWALRWLVDAAPVLAAQAPKVAVEFLRRAVASAPAGSEGREVLLCRLADALYRVGEHDAAERVAADALGQVAELDRVVDLHCTLMQCRAMAGRARESLVALDKELARENLTARARARLTVLAARTHWHLGEVARAGEVATAALAEDTDRWTTAWALHVLTIVAMVRGEMPAALPMFERALAVSQDDPALTDLRLLLQINHAVTLGELDRPAEALTAARQVRRSAERTGSVVRLAQAQSALGQLLLDTGRWDDAIAEVDVLADESKDPTVACCDHGVAALICFHRGEPADARRHLAAAAPYAEQLGGRVIGQLAVARSADLEHEGTPVEALAVLRAALRNRTGVEDLLADAVRLAVLVGDRATARAATRRAEALGGAAAAPHRRAASRYCRGLLDDDPATLLLAADAYREAGRPLPRAAALEAAAVGFADAGDRGSARAAFTGALDLFASLGAAWDVSRLQARFRGYGIRRGPRVKHRQARSGWESLTPTEATVAGLVVLGLSNPQIAARLYLSPRTVATHVSHVLAKLGLHSRIDIAREATARPGTGRVS